MLLPLFTMNQSILHVVVDYFLYLTCFVINFLFFVGQKESFFFVILCLIIYTKTINKKANVQNKCSYKIYFVVFLVIFDMGILKIIVLPKDVHRKQYF
jgi:hypothetical protein